MEKNTPRNSSKAQPPTTPYYGTQRPEKPKPHRRIESYNTIEEVKKTLRKYGWDIKRK
ncbi:hypothetical protein ACWZQY_026975 [Priestia megaterium]